MEAMSSESEQRLHGEHELQMSETEKTEQNDREIAAFLTKYGDLWLRERDLNPRPPGYEPDELPNCSTPRYKDVGAGDRDRTGTGLLPRDFKSRASASSATPAYRISQALY